MISMGSDRPFRAYATVWAAEDKGNYGQARFTTSRKDKQTEEYKNSSWSFVNFVGNGFERFDELMARLDDSEKGVRIIIKSMSIQNEPYEDAEGEKKYPKSPRMVVWDWIFSDEDEDGEQEEQPRRKAAAKSSKSSKPAAKPAKRSNMDKPPKNVREENPLEDDGSEEDWD